MGYLPQFKNDLFISYRHASNAARDKWVDRFREELVLRLEDLVGKIDIWRDQEEILAGDQWRQRISDALEDLMGSGLTFCYSLSGRNWRYGLMQFQPRLRSLRRARGWGNPSCWTIGMPRRLSFMIRWEWFI